MWGLTCLAFASAAQLNPQQTGEQTYFCIRHIPAEGDLAMVDGEQAVIGDGHAMGIVMSDN